MKLTAGGLFELLAAKATGPGARVARPLHQLGIWLGMTVMVLGTVPTLSASVQALLTPIFWTIAVLFSIEYVLRILLAPWAHWAHRGEPLQARVHLATSFLGLVDFAATWPLIALALGMEDGAARLFGAFWLVKLAPYAEGLALVGRVLRTARGPLLSLSIGFVMVIVLAATLAYVLEREAQPDTFGSIPLAMWWAITTLTTVGYGDAVPVTTLGRFLAGFVMVCGIAVLAMWAGILATTFSDEMRRRAFLRTWDLVSRVPYISGLGAGTIAEITRLLKVWDVAAGTVVMRRGEPGDCMYFIAEGEVEVRINPPLRLKPGAFFGEIALITGEARSATAAAATDCQLLLLDLADFRALAGCNPDLAEAIEAEAKKRRAQIDELAPAK